jgi:hypothetical protein
MSLEPVKEPEIHIAIAAGGEITTEVFHVTGPACRLLTKSYDELFATVSETQKADYHETVKAAVCQPARL